MEWDGTTDRADLFDPRQSHGQDPNVLTDIDELLAKPWRRSQMNCAGRVTACRRWLSSSADRSTACPFARAGVGVAVARDPPPGAPRAR